MCSYSVGCGEEKQNQREYNILSLNRHSPDCAHIRKRNTLLRNLELGGINSSPFQISNHWEMKLYMSSMVTLSIRSCKNLRFRYAECTTMP
jgi:hypothetical protein